MSKIDKCFKSQRRKVMIKLSKASSESNYNNLAIIQISLKS